MSLRAITEFIIHLEHFRNVDLIQQGLYFLKIQIFSEKNDKIYYANPYDHETRDTDVLNQKKEESKVSFHRLIEPYITDQNNSFYSKTFFVRYAEELVVLRDIIKFRSEIDVEAGYLETEFFLKTELYYQAPPTNNFSRCMNSAKEMQTEIQKTGNTFKMVQARLYQLNKALMGISSFVPLQFDREYTCLTMCTVHASLIDYRFRMLPQPKLKTMHVKSKGGQMPYQVDQSVIDDEDQSYIQNGIIVEPRNDLTEQERQKLSHQAYLKAANRFWLPTKIGEFLFYDDQGQFSVSEEQVKALFSEFKSLMKSIYGNMAKKYETIIKNVVVDQDLDQIDFPLIAVNMTTDHPSKLLTPEMAAKLNYFNDIDDSNFYDGDEFMQSPNKFKKEEEKYSEGKLGRTHSQSENGDQQQSLAKMGAINQSSVSQSTDLSSQFDGLHIKYAQEQQQAGVIENDAGLIDDSCIGVSPETKFSSSVQNIMQQQNKKDAFYKKAKKLEDSLSPSQMDEFAGSTQTPNVSSKLRGLGSQGLTARTSAIIKSGQKQIFQSKFNQKVEFSVEDTQAISSGIVRLINIMAGQLFELHNNLFRVLLFKPRRVYKHLSKEYQSMIERRYGENILRHVVLTQTFSQPSEDFTGALNETVAKKTREVIKMHLEMDGQEQNPIDELNIVADEQGKKNRRQKNMEKYAPLIFEECYIKNKGYTRVANTFEIEQHQDLKNKTDPSICNSNYKGMHLFVLVHGFQGSSFDLRVFKNTISVALPDALFLCATANEQDSDLDIFEMGEKLAMEVIQYIRESCPGSSLGRLSFIAHSLGGLITRAALPHLEAYKDKFHGLMTLCSPHLGFMYKTGKLVGIGVAAIKYFKKSIVLNQLTMVDSKNIEQTVLYRLTQAKGIDWFNYIILVSSYQDQYAPYDSARIQICSEAMNDRKKGNTYIQMVNNILERPTNKLEVLYRLDVNFNIEESNVDSIIGRTAHILFLENEQLMKMMVSRYKMFFN